MVTTITVSFSNQAHANPYDATARKLESEVNRLVGASESNCDQLLDTANNYMINYTNRSSQYGNDSVALNHYKNSIYHIRFAKRQGCSWAENIPTRG